MASEQVLKVCSLPGCDARFPLREVSYTLGDQEGEYCSGSCVQRAYDLMKSGKKFSKGRPQTVKEAIQEKPKPHTVAVGDEELEEVQVIAEDFGSAGIIRRYCDNIACKKPITLCWKGRDGEYCSNRCLKITEKEKNKMTAEVEEEIEDQEEEDDEDSPVTTGKAKGKAKKAVAKKGKAVAKKAAPAKGVAKKAAPAAASSNGASRSKYADDAVITVKKTDHEFKGNRGAALDALKNGMTVAKYREALAKKGGRMSTYVSWALNTASENKMITLK